MIEGSWTGLGDGLTSTVFEGVRALRLRRQTYSQNADRRVLGYTVNGNVISFIDSLGRRESFYSSCLRQLEKREGYNKLE